jgi:hypothetical protein
MNKGKGKLSLFRFKGQLNTYDIYNILMNRVGSLDDNLKHKTKYQNALLDDIFEAITYLAEDTNVSYCGKPCHFDSDGNVFNE